MSMSWLFFTALVVTSAMVQGRGFSGLVESPASVCSGTGEQFVGFQYAGGPGPTVAYWAISAAHPTTDTIIYMAGSGIPGNAPCSVAADGSMVPNFASATSIANVIFVDAVGPETGGVATAEQAAGSLFQFVGAHLDNHNSAHFAAAAEPGLQGPAGSIIDFVKNLFSSHKSEIEGTFNKVKNATTRFGHQASEHATKWGNQVSQQIHQIHVGGTGIDSELAAVVGAELLARNSNSFKVASVCAFSPVRDTPSFQHYVGAVLNSGAKVLVVDGAEDPAAATDPIRPQAYEAAAAWSAQPMHPLTFAGIPVPVGSYKSDARGSTWARIAGTGPDPASAQPIAVLATVGAFISGSKFATMEYHFGDTGATYRGSIQHLVGSIHTTGTVKHAASGSSTSFINRDELRSSTGDLAWYLPMQQSSGAAYQARVTDFGPSASKAIVNIATSAEGYAALGCSPNERMVSQASPLVHIQRYDSAARPVQEAMAIEYNFHPRNKQMYLFSAAYPSGVPLESISGTTITTKDDITTCQIPASVGEWFGLGAVEVPDILGIEAASAIFAGAVILLFSVFLVTSVLDLDDQEFADRRKDQEPRNAYEEALLEGEVYV